MLQLNLPAYQFTLKNMGGKAKIFDVWRRRFVTLTPEEWVRQHFLTFLVREKGFPQGLVAVEQSITLNGMSKRCDAVVYDSMAQPLLIVELKAPHVPLSQKVFDQVAVYNNRLNVRFFMLSNGLEHYACQVDREAERYVFFSEIPTYQQLIELR